MDLFPIELWLQIAPLACTDGGYTARSLQLVSRQMRDVVEPTRFTSVSLTTERQLLALSRFLPRDEQETSPRPSICIRYLLVAVRVPYWGNSDAEEKERRMRLHEALRSLLTTAAPTVQALTLFNSCLDIIGSDVTFPLLEDLCIGRFNACAGDFPLLPSLRRLHISQEDCWGTFWPQLTQLAPPLTHIRLTGVSQDADFPRLLRFLLGLRNPGVTEDIELSRLRCVIAEPLEDKRCCNIAIVKALVRAVVEECKQGAGRGMLYVLPDIVEYPVSEAQREWLELVEGGNGPWATPEERAARPLPPPAVVHKRTMTDRINSALRTAQNNLRSRMRGGK
ncbi:hypothetical protein PsYK624_158970 [Phanerochaete sordida]|uniref:Uncharacterized protein n=1 Tax=Phanerochaete sordida TaxID=48140 RepID=A0A9P3LLK9_9APHY|nr:hypothetical protein PsYK624_158970 [Phanerochaete sordida]